MKLLRDDVLHYLELALAATHERFHGHDDLLTAQQMGLVRAILQDALHQFAGWPLSEESTERAFVRRAPEIRAMLQAVNTALDFEMRSD